MWLYGILRKLNPLAVCKRLLMCFLKLHTLCSTFHVPCVLSIIAGLHLSSETGVKTASVLLIITMHVQRKTEMINTSA